MQTAQENAKMDFNLLGRNFTLSVLSIDTKPSPLDKPRQRLHYQYKMELKGNKTSFTFDFHGSIAEHEKKETMKADQLPFVFYCILSDAQTGEMDDEEYEGNFGAYPPYEMMKACKDTLENFRAVGIHPDDIGAAIEDLQEQYPESM